MNGYEELLVGFLVIILGMVGTIVRWAFQFNRKYGYPETPVEMIAELVMGGVAAPVGLELLAFLNIPFPAAASKGTVALLLGFFGVDVMEMIFARFRPAVKKPPSEEEPQ